MFVNDFSDVEKKCFSELLILMAGVDGNVSGEEKELLETYRNEMGLSRLPELTRSLDEIVLDLKSSDKSVKQAIYFELYVLVRADNIIDDSEIDLLNDLSKRINLEADKLKQIEDAVVQLSDAYDAVSNAVLS